MSKQASAEKVVRDIRCKTRRKHSTEEKIRVVLEGLRGEESIAAQCRLEGIAESLYYSWSKEFWISTKIREQWIGGWGVRQKSLVYSVFVDLFVSTHTLTHVSNGLYRVQLISRRTHRLFLIAAIASWNHVTLPA